MKTYNSIEELQQDSVKVVSGTITVFPQYEHEEVLDVSWAPKFNGCFSTNNSTVAFICNNTLYVTPYTRSVMSSLGKFNLKNACFYVPFSNWDYPKAEEYKWKQLRESADVDADEAFTESCIDFCERHGIGEIDNSILANCFKMPNTGVHVKHVYYDNVHYPIIMGKELDYIAIDRLGSFCCNNGKVVFVYRDGHTYVAKGYRIAHILLSAGYRETGLFVPFSNGEVITNPSLAAKWEALPKQ